MGTIKTTNIEPIADNGTVTLGSSGDTFTLGSGVVQSNLNYPAFEARLSANQGSVANQTFTKVQFDTESFDTDNCYDNSTNYRFTPTVAGKYFVYSYVNIHSSASFNLINTDAAIYKNGSIYTSPRNNQGATSPNYHAISQMVYSVIFLNGSSDYLEIFGRASLSTGTVSFLSANNTKSTIFGAYRIGS